MDRNIAIPPEDEAKLAKGIITLEKWGWGLTRHKILNIVEKFVTVNKSKTPIKNDCPGEDWFLRFGRAYTFSIKKPQSVEIAPKKCLDPLIIDQYFQLLKEQLCAHQLENKPRKVWNVDETNFSLNPSRTKIVGKRGVPSSRTMAGSGRENSLLMAVSTDGHKAPPLIVYKSKNMWDECIAPASQAYPSTRYAATKKKMDGWSLIFLFPIFKIHY